MTHSIGSFGPIGTRGLANAAIDPSDTTVDAAGAQPEHAAGLPAAMKPQPSRAERHRGAGEPAGSADDDAIDVGDGAPSPGGTSPLGMAPQMASMAAMAERIVQAPLHRLPGDGAPIRRIDRRRKRNC